MVMVRRAALESAGWFDERLLFQAQQADLCWRLTQAGWRVIHTPTATVRGDRRAAADRVPEEQSAFARMQFARKHLLAFPGYRATLVLRYGLRAGAFSVMRSRRGLRARASRAALATVVSGAAPPLARR
jgi:GT2 family glycosyltransferase